LIVGILNSVFLNF